MGIPALIFGFVGVLMKRVEPEKAGEKQAPTEVAGELPMSPAVAVLDEIEAQDGAAPRELTISTAVLGGETLEAQPAQEERHVPLLK